MFFLLPSVHNYILFFLRLQPPCSSQTDDQYQQPGGSSTRTHTHAHRITVYCKTICPSSKNHLINQRDSSPPQFKCFSCGLWGYDLEVFGVKSFRGIACRYFCHFLNKLEKNLRLLCLKCQKIHKKCKQFY